MADTYTVPQEGMWLSLIPWRRFRGRREGYVEKMLDLNPGLSAQGPFLQVGTVIAMPAVEVEPFRYRDTAISLWG